MLRRIELSPPIDYNGFYAYNGNCKKWLTDWRFNLPYEALCQLDDWGYEVGSLPSLTDILKIVGSHATLWIGERLQGVVAPMDVEPVGWTYANRQFTIAPQWFWLWYPNPHSQAILVKDANLFADDPSSLFEERSALFKSLVPFNLTRDRGHIQQVNAIPVSRLPGMLRSEFHWLFQWQGKSDV